MHPYRTRRLPCLAALPLALAGCASTANVATRDINATISVYPPSPDSPPPQTTVVVSLRNGVSTLSLAEGDRLSVRVDDTELHALAKRDDTGIATDYLATVAGDDCKSVTVVFERGNKQNAMSSTIACPPAMIVTAPSAQQAVPYANLVLTWSNPVAGARVNGFAYPCGANRNAGFAMSSPVADSGSYEVPATILAPTKPTAPTCTTILLQRQVVGPADAAFSSSSTMTIMRTYTVDVVVTP